MLKFLLLQPFIWLTAIFCYLTNPIVVLFADEEGNLPGFLHLWQTWDDSCDTSLMVLENMPKIFQYDFYSKYEEHKRLMPEYNRIQYYNTLKPGATFSTWERIQRYFCRVGWLTRNCAYGFAFYWFGITLDPSKAKAIIKKPDLELGYNGPKGRLWLDTPFVYKDSRVIATIFNYHIELNIYVGWKFDAESNDTTPTRFMCANRYISFKFRKGN